MQLMRQGVNARRYICSQFFQFMGVAANFTWQVAALSKAVAFDCQYRKPLVDIIVKFSGDACSLLLLRLNQLSGHTGERFFRLLAVSNVLREDENPPGHTVDIEPRANFPTHPLGTVFTIPAVFGLQCFSLKTTAMHFFPVLGKVRKKFVVRTSLYLSTIDGVVCTPAVAHLEIAHVTVEHRHSRWCVLDEDFQQFFP